MSVLLSTMRKLRLTVQSILCLVDLIICFSYTVFNLLRDCLFKTVKSLLCIRELCAITLTHGINLTLELFTKHSQLVFELGTESFESIIDSLGLRFCEVAIGLNFALNVLELGLELLFRLDALHEHDIVVAIHLHQLAVHSRQRHVFILLSHIACHVLFNEFHFGRGHFRFHKGIACSDQSGRPLIHHI